MLPWDVLPARGTLYLPAPLPPFLRVPMIRFAWQWFQKATSTCVAPTVVCLLVSRLLLIISHVYHSLLTYPITKSTFIPSHCVWQLHSLWLLRLCFALTVIIVNLGKIFKNVMNLQLLFFFHSYVVASLRFPPTGLSVLTQSYPLSPFVSALEAVSREPSIPLLVQVPCIQNDLFSPACNNSPKKLICLAVGCIV